MCGNGKMHARKQDEESKRYGKQFLHLMTKTLNTIQMFFKDIVIYIGRTLLTVSLVKINNLKVNYTENKAVYNNLYLIELEGMEYFHKSRKHNNRPFSVSKLFYSSHIRKRTDMNLQTSFLLLQIRI